MRKCWLRTLADALADAAASTHDAARVKKAGDR
jgi:hypothetical protein